MGQLGAIAAGHELSARAGAEVLADSGNAIDAAAAGVFAACICEPTLTGLGGAGFATIHLADGTELCLDFFATVPGLERSVASPSGPVPVDLLFGAITQTFHVGPQSCAVPGFVAGVLGMHERFGVLPRQRILEPAIHLARTGLGLTAEQAYCHHLLEGILTRRSFGRAVFSPDGPMLTTGDHFAQPELAETLEVLAAHGADAMYTGELAEQIVQWADDNDALISRADLSSYEVRELRPVRSTWRGLEFLSVPPPSSGGSLVSYALRVLARERGDRAIDVGSEHGISLLVGAMAAAEGARGSEFDGYLYDGGLEEWILTDEVIDRGVAMLRTDAAAHGASAPSSRLGSTTHLSTIDASGNAVSITASTGCGSGEFVGGTGIHLNNMLGEEDLVPVERTLHPGNRLTSMMAPTLVLAHGTPLLATGSAGSSRLRSAILQSFLRMVESRYIGEPSTLQQRADAAVRSPRVHLESGTVHVEPGYEAAGMAWLQQSSHRLNRWPDANMYFGGVNMVAWDPATGFAASADPRRGGGSWVVASDGSLTSP